jgi:hypothetical protein
MHGRARAPLVGLSNDHGAPVQEVATKRRGPPLGGPRSR